MAPLDYFSLKIIEIIQWPWQKSVAFQFWGEVKEPWWGETGSTNVNRAWIREKNGLSLIRSKAEMEWAPYSPDLNHRDFFLWVDHPGQPLPGQPSYHCCIEGSHYWEYSKNYSGEILTCYPQLFTPHSTGLSTERRTSGTCTLFTNPSARAGYDTRSAFKRSLTGLNSEFSFS